jgi:hypothetical protein
MQSLKEKVWNALKCKFIVSGASPQVCMFLEISQAKPVLAHLVWSLAYF